MDQMKQTLKDSAVMRWFVLVLISVLFFATYWFQDVFSPLKDLMESQMGVDPNDFGTLLSTSTWANCLGMIILGGIILDKWGIRVSGVLFGILVTAGGALTALGASDVLTSDPDNKLIIMAVGRVVFGIGLEITCVIVSRTVVKWFKGKELALAMAINVGFGRLGSFFANSFSLDIAGGAVTPAVTFAATLIGAGFIMFLIYLIFDVKLDKQLALAEPEDDEQFKMGDLLKLIKNPTFLWIALLCVAYYSAVFPFTSAYGPSIMVHTYGFAQALPEGFGQMGFFEQVQVYLTNGGKVIGLIPLGSIIFTPIFGSFMDRKGKAATMMFLGSGLLIFAHVSLAFIPIPAFGYAALLCLGIAFSLVPAAMWPSVAKIVPENRLGTAYATMFTIQNLGLALFFWLPGKIQELTNEGISEAVKAGQASYDYTWAIVPFIALGVVSIWLAYQLKRSDKKHDLGLERPFSGMSS